MKCIFPWREGALGGRTAASSFLAVMGMPTWSCQSVGGRTAAASLGWIQPVCKFGWGEEAEGDQFTLRATVNPHLSLWILSDNKLASVLRYIREIQSQSKQQFQRKFFAWWTWVAQISSPFVLSCMCQMWFPYGIYISQYTHTGCMHWYTSGCAEPQINV